MTKKRKEGQGGIVYSTDPGFRYQAYNPEGENLPASEQILLVRLDTKQRAGKTVTLVEGFMGNIKDLEELGRELKSACGTGGSVKDGLILIQGNYLEKLKKILRDKHFRLKN